MSIVQKLLLFLLIEKIVTNCFSFGSISSPLQILFEGVASYAEGLGGVGNVFIVLLVDVADVQAGRFFKVVGEVPGLRFQLS